MKRGKFEARKNERPTESSTPQEQKRNGAKSAVLYLHDIVYLLVAVILIFLLMFRVAVVSGSSMYNTLVDGDYLLLLSSTFYNHPKQGDIVIISKASFEGGKPIVKRVIATSGQTVDIDFDLGIVYVDGKALDEPYTYSRTDVEEGVTFPLKVDEGCIFVMGDNRHVSKDSRSSEIGLIDEREVLGKAIFLAFPGRDNGKREFGRIGALT